MWYQVIFEVVAILGVAWLFNRMKAAEDRVSHRIDQVINGMRLKAETTDAERLDDRINPVEERLAALEEKAEITPRRPPLPRSWRQRRILAERGEQYEKSQMTTKS